jgi:hypothetical protein
MQKLKHEPRIANRQLGAYCGAIVIWQTLAMAQIQIKGKINSSRDLLERLAKSQNHHHVRAPRLLRNR